MEKNLSLWQRFSSATPLFFKKLQLFGIGLAGVGTSLTQVIGIPARLTTALIAVGTTITIISQFAVQQCGPLTTAPDETK